MVRQWNAEHVSAEADHRHHGRRRFASSRSVTASNCPCFAAISRPTGKTGRPAPRWKPRSTAIRPSGSCRPRRCGPCSARRGSGPATSTRPGGTCCSTASTPGAPTIASSSPDRPFVRDQWRIKHGFAVDADRQSRELLAERVFSPGISTATANNRVSTITVYNTELLAADRPGDSAARAAAARRRVEDAAGKVVPSQRLSTGEFAFLATDVPPLAGKPFTIKAGHRRDRDAPASPRLDARREPT